MSLIEDMLALHRKSLKDSGGSEGNVFELRRNDAVGPEEAVASRRASFSPLRLVG
jgi:hypothetical protein